jgi:hypothetical protein
VSGAACQMQYTYCTQFGEAFFQLADEGAEICLESNEGIDINSFGPLSHGSCTADGALLEGAVTPIDPRTVCCLD